jgi:hypothetical protein
MDSVLGGMMSLGMNAVLEDENVVVRGEVMTPSRSGSGDDTRNEKRQDEVRKGEKAHEITKGEVRKNNEGDWVKEDGWGW